MRRHRACRALVAPLAALALAAVGAAAAPREESADDASEAGTPLEVILERAGAYVTRYGDSFRNLVAEEAYRQTLYTYDSLQGSGAVVRHLRSDKGGKTIAGFPTVEMAFHERVRPTLVRDRWREDVPASGSFWIDPVRGTVLRTEIKYDITRKERAGAEKRSATEVVLTRYRRESGLDIFVPDKMEEWYRSRAGSRLDGKARYSKYRRFRVTSDWEVVDAEEP